MKTLINIFGAGRSGTTMLDLMLGHDEKSFSLGEVHAWFRPFRKHHFNIICSCSAASCPYWDKIKNLPEFEFHLKAFELLNVDFLIDSSKNLNWGIDNNIWGIKNNFQVINIVLYKNPINYVYSIWKRGENIDDAIYRYTIYYKYFLQTNLPYVAIEYEQLVNNTDTILKEICTITGQKYFKNKKNFWEKEHHHIFGSMGTRKQIEKGSSSIRDKEVFPEEYQKIIPEIETKLKNNKDFTWIKEELLTHDIKYGFQEATSVIHKPYWYYLRKVKAIYKKNFPNEWKYSQ